MPTAVQGKLDILVEWGEQGVRTFAPLADVTVVVDVLSFSTCVEIAASRGALVFPYRWKDESAERFAREVKADVACPRGSGRFSLSPVTFLSVEPGTRIVLPSPNGATLSLGASPTPTLIGCLRNATAVAAAAQRIGRTIALVPAGERWPDGSLRPALEDWLGVGAVAANLAGVVSPEAEAARDAFRSAAGDLEQRISDSPSGRELLARGYPDDVRLACQLDLSTTVPRLMDKAFVPWAPDSGA